MAAIGKQTLDFEEDVKLIEKKLTNSKKVNLFEDVFDPLEKLGAPLDMTWGVSKMLYLGNSSLMPTKSYMAIHERAKRARAAKFNSYLIYEACLRSSNDDSNKTDEQKRLIQKFVLEGKLNGLLLDSNKKACLQENLNKITKEKYIFKTKTEFSTKKFSHTIKNSEVVQDFPPDLLKLIAEDPSKYSDGPWRVTLQPQIYIPFMEYCPERDLRYKAWYAMVGRGSGYGDRELMTSLNLEELRFLRRDQANILGYETYADMSMETKMAGSVENVQHLLKTLLEYAKPAQEKELNHLYDFAKERGFEGTSIELWDVPYWKRKQQKTVFSYNEKEIQQYFPLPKVLDGLFELCEKLFSITIKQRSNVSTWHKDVKYYDIFEPHSSPPVAGFYFDPYARSEDKIRQNNGCIVGIQNHSRIAETKPLAALIFNFHPPSSDKPSTLTFNEVSLLFYKFGHALQHLLSRTCYSEVSGLSNVEWDVVEVCGHVLSHWLYNKKTIDCISSHVESEDVLPLHLFDTLLNVRRHMAGFDLSRELYLSALDLELHSSKDFWLDIVKRLWHQYRCLPLSKIDSHPCSFTQIFCEEWSAAYFSHIWSRVIAADVYSAFHEARENEQEIVDVGKRFRDTFLALGGSSHPSQTFRKFRGRDPSPKALLRSLNLKKGKSEQS